MSETQRGGGRAEVDRRSDAVYTFGDFCLLPGRRKLLLAGQPIHIGSRAFAILVALVERAGTVVSAGELTALV